MGYKLSFLREGVHSNKQTLLLVPVADPAIQAIGRLHIEDIMIMVFVTLQMFWLYSVQLLLVLCLASHLPRLRLDPCENGILSLSFYIMAYSKQTNK